MALIPFRQLIRFGFDVSVFVAKSLDVLVYKENPWVRASMRCRTIRISSTVSMTSMTVEMRTVTAMTEAIMIMNTSPQVTPSGSSPRK